MAIIKRFLSNKRIMILTLIEGLIIFLTLLSSISVRFGFNMGEVYSFDPLFLKSFSFVVICLVSFHYFELYNSDSYRSFWVMSVRLLQALLSSFALTFVFYYLFPLLKIGRGIILIEILVMPVFIMGWRYCYVKWIAKGLPSEKVIILGSASLAKKLDSEIKNQPNLGVELIGLLEDDQYGRSREGVSKNNR